MSCIRMASWVLGPPQTRRRVCKEEPQVPPIVRPVRLPPCLHSRRQSARASITGGESHKRQLATHKRAGLRRRIPKQRESADLCASPSLGRPFLLLSLTTELRIKYTCLLSLSFHNVIRLLSQSTDCCSESAPESASTSAQRDVSFSCAYAYQIE